MKLKLYRDKVVSVVRGRDLVGVYVIAPLDANGFTKDGIGYEIPAGAEILLGEMSPKKADAILKLWNAK
jgi:hypothetical protein